MSEFLTIHEAAARIRAGKLRPIELFEQCWDRIDRYEAQVRAWAYLDYDGARRQAEQLTQEWQRNHYRGPLHGIPLGIKDIIDVFDMPTGCGSTLWATSFARADAECVRRLRQAGAIILGKTVTTAYASFDPPPTRNPWHLERTPGGSSSGSAAAVACGMCLGALATQTGGSITRPASFCGVVSLKPTWGRVSVTGVLPLAPRLDHVGVMASSATDCAILFDAIRTAPTAPRRIRQRLLEPNDAAAFGLLEPTMAEAFATFRTTTATRDWHWHNHTLPPSFADVRHYHYLLMAVGAAAYHGERFQRRPHDYPPSVSQLIRDGLQCSAADYERALKHHAQFQTDIDHSFPKGWDTFATPAAPGPAPSADTTGNPVFNAPWSYAGLPTLSLPIGWSREGLPLSVQLIGRRHHDEQLLQLAQRLEATCAIIRPPLPL